MDDDYLYDGVYNFDDEVEYGGFDLDDDEAYDYDSDDMIDDFDNFHFGPADLGQHLAMVQMLHQHVMPRRRRRRTPERKTDEHSPAEVLKFPSTVLRRAIQINGPQVVNTINRHGDIRLTLKKFNYVHRLLFTPKNGTPPDPRRGFGKKKNFFAHPDIDDMLIPANIVVNVSLIAEHLPAGFITKLVERNWHFNVKNLFIDESTLNRDEFYDLFAYGRGINRFAITRSRLDKRVMITEIAHFIRRATRIDLDLQNVIFEKDWIKSFHDHDGKLKFFRIRNAAFNFTLDDWNTFMGKVDRDADIVHLYLAENAFPGAKNKTIITRITKFFAESYAHVPKDQFDDTDNDKRFAVSIFNKRHGARGLYFSKHGPH